MSQVPEEPQPWGGRASPSLLSRDILISFLVPLARRTGCGPSSRGAPVTSPRKSIQRRVSASIVVDTGRARSASSRTKIGRWSKVKTEYFALLFERKVLWRNLWIYLFFIQVDGICITLCGRVVLDLFTYFLKLSLFLGRVILCRSRYCGDE